MSAVWRTVVQELGEADAQALLDAAHLPVHGEGLDVQVSMVQDGASWGLINTCHKDSVEVELNTSVLM